MSAYGSLSRAQLRVAKVLADGGHIQLCSGRNLDEDPYAIFVLVHTCDPTVDPDGFLYTETVQYRTLFALHMRGRLTDDAEVAIGFVPGEVILS